MKDCEKILNELYWRMKVMVEEKEKGRDDLDEHGLKDKVWRLYGHGVFDDLMDDWYYENYLGVGYGESWGRDYGQVLLDFIEFIGISVFLDREIETKIVLVGKWWMEFLMNMNRESGLRLDSMIFELINVYKGSEGV